MSKAYLYTTRPDARGGQTAYTINMTIASWLIVFGTLAALLWTATALVYWFVFMYGVIA